MLRSLLLLVGIFVGICLSLNMTPDADLHKRSEWNSNCRGETYCSVRSKLYPSEYIEKMLQNIIINYDRNSDTEFDYRNGDYRSLCEFDSYNSPIYEIIDEHDSLRYVVQSENKFKQLIKLEKCRFDEISQSEERGYTLSCKEKRMDYKFMVLSKDGQYFEWVKVKDGLPVACYCHMETVLEDAEN